MSVLLFLLVLAVLVLVHEWGHFIVAKKTGMRVDEFGIGFPPKAYSIKKGETEYSLNWLPIGGFVRIFGENLEEAERLEVDKQDVSRSFAARPKWAQALVLIAGVTMNVLFAWLLLMITLMIGVPTPVDEVSASAEAKLYIVGTLADSPAVALPESAEIISVASGEDVLEVYTPSEFGNFITTVAPAPVTLTYNFNDETETVTLTPSQGIDETDPDRYLLGVSLALVENTQASFFEAVVESAKMTWDILVSIIIGVSSLITESIRGVADYSQIAGPVGIVNLVGDAASFGLASLLTFTAIISLNLAVINLLPIPALDGGRLVFVAIEAVTGKHIPAVWATRVNFVGFVFLMLLMVAVTYNDIVRLI
jgi:regulator of sigma E protease